MRGRRISAAIGLSLVLAACGSEGPTEQVQATASAPSDDATAAGGTVPAVGTSVTAGSCIEQYSIETLKNRDYAFAGTIKSIESDAADGPDAVVFTVQEWFKGAARRPRDATRKAYGFGSVTSAGGTPHAVGQRLLVAGDEDFVWECGFTQPYDAEVAADWDEAL